MPRLLERVTKGERITTSKHGVSIAVLQPYDARKSSDLNQEWPDNRMEELLAIGRANNLSSYDASYLYLAMRKGLPIATLDQKLIAAAREVEIALVEV